MENQTGLELSLRRVALLGSEVLDRASRRRADRTPSGPALRPLTPDQQHGQDPLERTHRSAHLDQTPFETMAALMVQSSRQCTKVHGPDRCSELSGAERRHASRYHRAPGPGTGGRPPPSTAATGTGGRPPPSTAATGTGGRPPPSTAATGTGGRPPPSTAATGTGGRPPPAQQPIQTSTSRCLQGPTPSRPGCPVAPSRPRGSACTPGTASHSALTSHPSPDPFTSDLH